MLTNKISLVIITYNRDFSILTRLLNSINTHCSIDQIHSIEIVLNDRDKWFHQLDLIVNNFSTLPITCHNANDIFNGFNAFNWNTQQYFKCKKMYEFLDTKKALSRAED